MNTVVIHIQSRCCELRLARATDPARKAVFCKTGAPWGGGGGGLLA